MEALIWIARVLLVLQFLKGGFDAAINPGGRAAKAARLKLPAPEIMVRVNGAAMVLGGLLVATGIFPEVGALILVLALIPTTIAGHAFWLEETPKGRNQQFTQFLKNAGLAGGLLLVVAIGADAAIVTTGL